MKKLILIGRGGHAKSVYDIALLTKIYETIEFFDWDFENPENNIFLDDIYLCVAIGDNKKRKLIYEQITNKKPVPSLDTSPYAKLRGTLPASAQGFGGRSGTNGLIFATIISPLAHMGENAEIASGATVGHFCHIGPEAKIGANTIINNGVIIEHETHVGDHCHIAPGATISGRTKINNLVFIGAGATVINCISICQNVIIGAGATVVKDICEPGTYVGVPARKLENK